jgi:hypothetical protein
MNCERFQNVASDLARNDIIEANERMSAIAHFEECDRCGQTWADQRALSEGLRAMAAQMNSLEAPAHLEEKLRATFRDRTSVRPIQFAPSRRRYWVSAAAAALLIVFGLLVWRAHVASLAQPPNEATSNGVASPKSSKPEQSPVVATAGNQRQNDSVSPKREPPSPKVAKSQRARHSDAAAVAKRPTAAAATAVGANTPTTEVTTDFVALGYGSAMDLQDGGQLVRVELPRSALARFGLPVNMDRADERVKADVLVGADGLARAIRFVK